MVNGNVDGGPVCDSRRQTGAALKRLICVRLILEYGFKYCFSVPPHSFHDTVKANLVNSLYHSYVSLRALF
jgi:hypothetical protein